MYLYEVAVRYMCREFTTTIKLAEKCTYYNVRQLKLWHIIPKPATDLSIVYLM